MIHVRWTCALKSLKYINNKSLLITKYSNTSGQYTQRLHVVIQIPVILKIGVRYFIILMDIKYLQASKMGK
jgi:hypothetical protein